MSKRDRRGQLQQTPHKNSHNMPYLVGGIVVVLLLIVYVVGKNLQSEKLVPAGQSDLQPKVRSAVAFQKQGELRFLDKSDNLLYAADIEVADDEAKRAQGLMYRDSMA